MADHKDPKLNPTPADSAAARPGDPAYDTRQDAAYTPTGSARAGTAAPKKRSGGALWITLLAVLAVLAGIWLFAGDWGTEEIAEPVDPVVAPGAPVIADEDVAIEGTIAEEIGDDTIAETSGVLEGETAIDEVAEEALIDNPIAEEDASLLDADDPNVTVVPVVPVD